MNRKTMLRSRRNFCRTGALLLPAVLAACTTATKTSAPTPAAPPTTTAAAATAAPSPTTRPSATPTALPDLHDGPFTWNGQTSPMPERPLLMAHFMPWYQAPPTHGEFGYHWRMNHFNPRRKDSKWTDLASHFTPLIGPYDSADPRVLEYQALTMKLSGIDGVIVDWYGIEPFWDYGLLHEATTLLFERVKEAGLKFSICYEDQTIKHMVDNNRLQAEEAVAHGQKVMQFLQDNWFQDDAYLKHEGRPVLYNFGPQFFKGDEWKKLFEGLDPQPLFVTLDKALVPGANAGFNWPPMWASKGGVLSHDVLLGYLNDFHDQAEDWPYKTGGAWPGFYDIYKEAGVGNGYGFLDALEGKTLRFTLQEALNQPQHVIQLVTWNDYGEGTNIEPTEEYGYRYLETVQEARRVIDPTFTHQPADLELPFRLWAQRGEKDGDEAAQAELDKAAQALLAGDMKTAGEILNADQ